MNYRSGPAVQIKPQELPGALPAAPFTAVPTFSKHAIHMLTARDQQQFELFGRGPEIKPPFNTIHQAIEAQAMLQPQAVAVEHLGQTLAYHELNKQADCLARLLIQRGVKVGDHVGLFLQRSIPMVVGILGILKAGATYVPQTIGVATRSQLRHVMQKAQTRVILTLSSLRDQIPLSREHHCIELDRLSQYAADLPSATPIDLPDQSVIHSELGCYVIFTSGTTGTPNGVKLSHGNVCNVLLTPPGDLGLTPGMRVGQLLSIDFDMAAWEILGALSHGATLVIRGKDIAETATQLDVIIATPSILASIDMDSCPRVKVVAVAGEPCPRPLANRWANQCRFYNACGPTETTIINTAQRYHPRLNHLTIGKPTPNNTVYILDENRRPCAIGEIGEMWAGGDCVSLGYLANPQLNAERYRPDPFLGNGKRMFRTKDLARWNVDGELEHFGRTDNQVKIRGFRIELDAVSSILETVESCTHAVTLKQDDRNLIAFMSPRTVDPDQARMIIKNKLPYYCMPQTIITLDKFPITSRGKIDKPALITLAMRKSLTDKDQGNFHKHDIKNLALRKPDMLTTEATSECTS